MEQARKLKSLSSLSLLLPFSLLAFYASQYFGLKVNTSTPTADLQSMLMIFVLPFVMTVGIISYLLWYHKLYSFIYERSEKLNFYPSIATILSHVPIVSSITLPLTLKEMWIHSSNQAPTRSVKLFIVWWALSVTLLIYLVVTQPGLVVPFWVSSIMLSCVWTYQICRTITHVQIQSYLSEKNAL